MEQRSTIVDRVQGHCGELVLRAAGGHHEIIADGMFLMDTRAGESERLLVDAAAERMPAGGHLVVGGLGVGFSLRAALAHPRVGRVTVVEREPAVIAWNEGPLGNAAVLVDPRVTVVPADLTTWLGHTQNRFDAEDQLAIHDRLDTRDPLNPQDCSGTQDGLGTQHRFDALCLDIDNGPDWTLSEANATLYSAEGLEMLRRRLTPTGVLAIWSASASPPFTTRLESVFDSVEVLEIPVARGTPDVVFLAAHPH